MGFGEVNVKGDGVGLGFKGLVKGNEVIFSCWHFFVGLLDEFGQSLALARALYLFLSKKGFCWLRKTAMGEGVKFFLVFSWFECGKTLAKKPGQVVLSSGSNLGEEKGMDSFHEA